MSDRVLLIGAAGLVGRHVRAALADREVVATFHHDPVDDGVAAVQLDITDGAAVRGLVARVRPAAIVLAAADPYVEGCERDPDGTRRVNVEAAAAVREAAADATLVVFSSEYVFDGRGGAYREDDPVAPLNVYGHQKVALEEIARSSPRHLILRVSGVFGAEPRRKNFVWQLVDRLRGGATFDVPSDQVVTPTDAPSLATALRELLDRGAVGTFHAAGPEILGRVEFARMIARAFDLDESRIRPRPTAELGLRAARPKQAGLSDEKLRALLGHGLRRPGDALADLAAID
jgi:dTDP-4-dehydrorhamnose reductase